MKKKLACGTGDVFDISRALVGVVVPVVPSFRRRFVVPSSVRRFAVPSSSSSSTEILVST